MTIKILLVDDHKIVRDGLRLLMETQPDLEVIAEAEDGRTAIELARTLSPQVVVMDVSMPGMNGIEATRRIVAEAPGVKVIALSVHSDKRFVLSMLRAGASGYLQKTCSFRELTKAIKTVMADQHCFPAVITDTVTQQRAHCPESQDVFASLTPREREVLQLITEGRSTRQIAEDLTVSIKTVETHRRQIMEKLDLRSVAELTKYAIREGLTSLES